MPDPIEEVEILNPFSYQDFAEEKLIVLDVRARDSAGRWLNIEMQVSVHAGLLQRLTCSFSRQKCEGERKAVRAIVDAAFESMWLAIRTIQFAIAGELKLQECITELLTTAEVVLGKEVIHDCLNEVQLRARTQGWCCNSEITLSEAFPSGRRPS